MPQQGSALELTYADEHFDKCYSVEAAQHFEGLAAFASEAYRVLRAWRQACRRDLLHDPPER